MLKKIKILVPSFVSMLSIYCGLTGLLMGLESKYHELCYLLLAAMICDFLDGMLARKLDACTELGANLDSLCDMINFGLVPNFVVFFWRLKALPYFGWLITTLSICSIAYRLARFNSNPSVTEEEKLLNSKFFQGVPSTIACLLYILPIMLEIEFDTTLSLTTICLYHITISTLCISSIATISLKPFKIIHLVGGCALLLVLVNFSIIALCCLVCLLYLLTLPVTFIYYNFKILKAHKTH